MNTKILWIDDKPEELVKHILALEARGFTVTTATSPSQGYSLMRSGTFDIVALDLDFPEHSNPQQLLSNTKKYCPDARIIVISEWMDVDHIRRGIELSSVKPVIETKPLPAAESATFLKIFLRLAENKFKKNNSDAKGQEENAIWEVGEAPKTVKHTVWLINQIKKSPLIALMWLLVIMFMFVGLIISKDIISEIIGVR